MAAQYDPAVLAGGIPVLTMPETSHPAEADQLERNALGTSDIVFMVLAASAPLAVVMGLMPFALAFGNGRGVPGALIIGGLAMLLFAVGYVRQIPFVRNAGAFYAYISASLSRIVGLPAAYIAAFSYLACCISTLVTHAFFVSDLVFALTGIRTFWVYWGVGALGLIGVLAYHRITMVAAVLTLALGAEILAIIVLDIAIVHNHGFGAFRISDLAPSSVFTPGLGIALIYTFTSMFGIEGTAIYQEEARNAAVTVPRATFISVLFAVLLYSITAWCLSTAVGSTEAGRIAARDVGHFVSDRARENLGERAAIVLQLLVITSTFAAVLGLFNSSTRYLYALARDGVLPRALGHTHREYHSPHIAGIFLTVLGVAFLVFAGIAGLDPLINIAPMFIGLGSLGLMCLLAITSLGIPIFFARRGEFGFGKTAAPLVGGLAVSACTVLAATNYSILTGVDNEFINSLPWALVCLAIAGAAQALYLRRYRPAAYQRIGQSRVEQTD